jgi:hypothetical protein
MSVATDLNLDELRVAHDEVQARANETARLLVARVAAYSKDTDAVVFAAALGGLLRQEQQLRRAIKTEIAG